MKKISFVLAGCAGTLLALGALTLGACSSEEGGTDSGPPKPDSGRDTGGGDTSNPPNDGGGRDGSDAAVMKQDCGVIPLFPSPEAGPYCPFQLAPDGGNAFGNCAIGQHCCHYAASAGLKSTCNNPNQACNAAIADGGYDWYCDEKSDCPGQVCCVSRNVLDKDNLCIGEAFITGVKGSTCKASCDSNTEGEACSSDADCSGGKACFTYKKGGKNLGVCLTP
jgi:hypothetical protein